MCSSDLIIAVFSGMGAVFAIDKDGNLWTWGNNGIGQSPDHERWGEVAPPGALLGDVLDQGRHDGGRHRRHIGSQIRRLKDPAHPVDGESDREGRRENREHQTRMGGRSDGDHLGRGLPDRHDPSRKARDRAPVAGERECSG